MIKAAEKNETLDRLVELDRQHFAKRDRSEASNSYSAGESSRMSPMPKGIDPLGSDADYHYRTERNYFLMVERGRAAVRNHPLVEQGINRLIANLRLSQFTLDVNSGDPGLDSAIQDEFNGWAGDKKLADYEQTRTFWQISKQSFFNQVADGDVLHLPLLNGQLQTWESHNIRNPYGHRSSGDNQNGIVHGAEVVGGRTVAYHVTPFHLLFNQSLSRRNQSRRVPVFDRAGNQVAFYAGFTHRFGQRRGISRLSAPREAMNGFDDLNYAHTKSALRRALISYLMKSTAPAGMPGVEDGGELPQAGDRYTKKIGLGIESTVVEQAGEPAMVMKSPAGHEIEGWNADMPGTGFFEHAALMLTMLSVNLDLPLMFLLMDGSLVNFHGGRMMMDQVKLRAIELQDDQITAFHDPVYRWKIRQWTTPGSPHFKPAMAAAVSKGADPYKFQFRKAGWPYVKPLEDAAAADLAERRNLKSLREILATDGKDIVDHRRIVLTDRAAWITDSIEKAVGVAQSFPDLEIDVMQLAREIAYGMDKGGIQLSLSAGTGESQQQPVSEG